MFLKLADNSFVKRKPGKNSNTFSIYNNNSRGSIVINDSASNILELCDGTNTLDDIVNILRKKYNDTEDNVKKNVTEFLQPFISSNIIQKIKNKTFSNIIKGDKNIAYPDVIVWELTDYCPLNCRHCYLPKKNNNIFSKDEIDKILKVIDKMGISFVQLTGGEVLTHPHIEYVIHQFIKRGIITTISTSGIILNNNILNALDELKLVKGSCCKVSLDGNKEAHTYIRQNEDSYDKAINFIKSVTNKGIECQIGSVILKQTQEEIEELTALVKSLGVSLLEFTLVFDQGNAKHNQLQSNMEIEDFHALLYELKNKYEDNKFLLKTPCTLTQKNCGAGHLTICIKANGTITPCPIMEIELGNLKKEGINDIINRCFLNFENLVSPCDKTCGNCKKFKICKSCIAQATINKNKVPNCKWYEAEKELLQPYIK